jgi:hypothetical protein
VRAPNVRGIIGVLSGILALLLGVPAGGIAPAPASAVEVTALASHTDDASSNIVQNRSQPRTGIGANGPSGAVSLPTLGSGVGTVLAAEEPIGLSPGQSWGDQSTLAAHFLRHGADFGATSAEDYASQASQFLQRAFQEGLPTKIGSGGVIRVYDPASNTFGAYNANGTTGTFYKPDPAVHGYPSNEDYWQSQPGCAPWEP